MQTLSNVPVSELRVGDRVKFKATGVEGFISNIVPYSSFEFLVDNIDVILTIKYETKNEYELKYAHVPFTVGSNSKMGHIWLM